MSRSVRIQVLLSKHLASRFEEYCEEKGFKKSTLIARLVREHLDRERYPSQRSLFTEHRSVRRSS